MTFNPKYTVTPTIIHAISKIEIVKHEVVGLPVTVRMISSLRESARLASTHHSTAIEGNLLSPLEVVAVIKNDEHFPHRQKDEDEVRNYYHALEALERLSKLTTPITENDIKLLHGISFLGKTKPTAYRDGQNVIKNGKLIVYIPPKAEEVQQLMYDLVEWILAALDQKLPIPIIAGLAHYQFATIHPYYDGNGRTARLLTTLILHKYGYDLKGIYCLEEYYAKNLPGYYDALTVGSDEDYYDGNRANSDLTRFLEYFTCGMADAFEKVCSQAKAANDHGNADQSSHLRNLTNQQRQIMKLFLTSREITANEVSTFFGYSDRQARYLCKQWVESGFLEISNASFKARSYTLTSSYESLIQKQMNHSEI